MAKAIKHTVVGAVGERKSPRIYTHAIVARIDWDKSLAQGLRNARSSAKDWFEYNTRKAAYKIGAPLFPGNAYLSHHLVTQKDIDEANAGLEEGGRTLEEAIAKAEQKTRARHESSLKASGRDTRVVLQWSQSAANATKAIGTWAQRNYLDVRVEPVVRHEKAPARNSDSTHDVACN